MKKLGLIFEYEYSAEALQARRVFGRTLDQPGKRGARLCHNIRAQLKQW